MHNRLLAGLLAAGLLGSAAGAAPLAKPPAFGICGVCHKVDKGAPNGVGPNLFAVGGTKAGGVPGFNFSPAMKKSGLTWDKPTLVKFIMEPQKTVPGTKMPYGGLKNQASAEAIADYILSLK